jgi:hypothetical protein
VSSIKSEDLNVNFDRDLAAVNIPKTFGSIDENDGDRSGYLDTTSKLVFES